MRMLIIIVALLFASPVAAQIQIPTGQQTVFARMDYPASSQSISINAGQVYFAGWAFNCYTRQQPSSAPNAPAVALYYLTDPDEQGVSRMVMLTSDGGGLAVYARGLRPDVAKAFGSICGGPVPPHVGVAIYPTAPLPLGARHYTLYIMDPAFGLGAAVQQFWLDVQP